MAGGVKKDSPDGSFVTGALVAVTTKGGGVKQLRFGDVVTDDITSESVDLLKSLGFVSDTNPLDAA